MTQEEKAKAYDEALAIASRKHKIMIEQKSTLAAGLLEELFPQLAESEDERIRKWLLGEMKIHYDFESPNLNPMVEKALAWLEKPKKKGRNITANLLEDGITGVQRELIEFLANNVDASWVDIIKSADAYAQRIRSMLEKQKEQKPAEWSEEDSDILRDAICAADILAKEFKKDNPHLSKTLRVAEEWLESLPERFTLSIKQEWDGFDEDCLKRAIWYVENPAPSVVKDTNLALWLKSLPERFNLQPKQEWSEEDEACIRNLESIIYYDKKLPNDTRVILGKFLSNLRPQPQGTYKQVIHTIFGMLKDKDFYEIQPSHRVSLLNDIRVKCKDAIECAPILDEPSWKPSDEDLMMLEHIIGQYETGNKNSKVMGYLPRVEELDFLKKVLAKWKNLL